MMPRFETHSWLLCVYGLWDTHFGFFTGREHSGENSLEENHIIDKQIAWATNRGEKLIGSHGEHGRSVYTSSVNANLFQPLNRQTGIRSGAESNPTTGVSAANEYPPTDISGSPEKWQLRAPNVST